MREQMPLDLRLEVKLSILALLHAHFVDEGLEHVFLQLGHVELRAVLDQEALVNLL
jgi:hypothetical protein